MHLQSSCSVQSSERILVEVVMHQCSSWTDWTNDRDLLCRLCGRHASFFGRRHGICSICECKKGRQVAGFIAFQIFRSFPIVKLVTDYIDQHPKYYLQLSVKHCWRRFFFCDEHPVYIWTGHLLETRDADTDDEDSDGILNANLNFVNPLMKLCVSRGRNSPIEIIIDMLPMPPGFSIELPLSHR